MPIIDGEKYACQSCIKGHRVSGCQHLDRQLTHINPKGRPVKQCEHCRGARKAKSHHARCDCGSKKEKEAAKERLKTELNVDFFAENAVESAFNPAAAIDDSGCCCYKGSSCVCGVKKDPLPLRLDTNFSRPGQSQSRSSKPRLTSTHSESHLTVFANGHHKPCHRLNNSAHTSGAPYKIPRSHTLHGPSSAGHQSHSSLGHFPSVPIQRSADDLGVGENFPQFSASMDSLPLNPLTETDGKGDASGLFYNAPTSNSGAASDHSSPIDAPSADAIGFTQWPWTTNRLSQSASQYSLEPFSTSPTAGDYMSSYDSDFPIPSAGLNPIWSAGDLPLDSGKLGKTMTPPMSLSGESNLPSVPGLTSGSSGAQSEAGDPICLADSDVITSQPTMADHFLYEEGLAFRRTERAPYRLNGSAKWPEYRQPPTSVPTNESHCSLDLDSLKRSHQARVAEVGQNVELDRPYSSMGMDAKAFNLYSGGEADYKPAPYLNMASSPRPMTMPSSPAETYAELTPWSSSLSLNASGYELPGEELNFNNTVDLPNYQYLS